MVPSETSFSNALNAPLDVVQSLFGEYVYEFSR